ncbi:hypothetical protein R5R35_001702 [Gryllus longicercus]|uniref:Uncharacterized protein n=1 Tax=Gryllus longicercus TaxID=2509291 RepID=A0AAN9V4A5_9ORTH
MGCAGFHNSAQCPVQDKINTQPKCANCTGAHPANYRECSFHLEALRVRNQQLARLRAAREQRSSNTPAQNNAQQRTDFPSLATPAASAPAWWGQAAQPPQSPQNPQPIGGQHALGALSELKELFDIVKGLNITKLITAAKTAINILKGPGDLLTKFLTAFQSVAEIF